MGMWMESTDLFPRPGSREEDAAFADFQNHLPENVPTGVLRTEGAEDRGSRAVDESR